MEYICPECGAPVFFTAPTGGFQPMGDRMLCELCEQAKTEEVEEAWQKTLRRASEN